VSRDKKNRATTSSRRFYDRIARAYDLIADPAEHASREAAVELLEVAPGERVLELGCGTGHALVDVARQPTRTDAICGLDRSPGMLSVARHRLKREGVRARLILGDARMLPCSDAVFDAVFMSFTLELFEPGDMHRVLAETRRALRPSGRLGVLAMAATGAHNPMIDLYTWLHFHFPHIVDCRPISIAEILEDGGFTVQRRFDRKIAGLPIAAVVATLAP